MTNIIFVNAQESSFDYDRSSDYQSVERKNNLLLGVRSELLYSNDLNLVGVRFYIALKYEKLQVLTYHVTLTFKVEGWEKLIKDKTDKEIISIEEVSKMLSVTVDFLRGSLFVQEKGTPFENMNLPLLSIGDLLEKMVVIKAEHEKS